MRARHLAGMVARVLMAVAWGMCVQGKQEIHGDDDEEPVLG